MNFGFADDLLNEDVLERIKDIFFLFGALVFCLFSLNGLSFLISSEFVSENVMSDALVRSEHLVHHKFTSFACVDKLNYLGLVGVDVVPRVRINLNFALIVLQSSNVNSCGASFSFQKVGQFLEVVSQVLRFFQLGIELLSALLFLLLGNFSIGGLFFGNFGLSCSVGFLLTDCFQLSFSLEYKISFAPKMLDLV